MGFTAVAFIHKNTPELRKKLEELGYKSVSLIEDRPCLFTSSYINVYHSIFAEWFDDDNPHTTYNCADRIDCGTNEDLFLAIAALRDDTDKHQWFTDGYHWEKCPDEVAYINAWIDRYEYSPHKATVEELIEHFRGKEE